MLTDTNEKDVMEEAKELLKQGLEYYEKDFFQQAKVVFKKLIALLEQYPPYTAELWDMLGQAYHCIGRYYDAINCYDCALELDNKFFTPLYNKSLTLKNMGKYYEALGSLNLYTLHSPNEYRTKNVEGLIYDELKEFDRAVDCFDKIIDDRSVKVKQELRIKAVNNKAMTLANKEEYDDALSLLDEHLPDNEEAFILDTRAFIFIKQEKYTQALDLLEKAARKSTNDKFIAYHRGVVYSKLGKSGQALRYYQDAIKIDDKFAEAHNDKAAELSKLGRYHEAKIALESAIKSKSGLVTAHENLIKISFQQHSFPTFWEFWKTSTTKKIAGCTLFILACFLIIFPLLAFIIPLMSDMIEKGYNFRTALANITTNNGTSAIESVIPITFIVGTAILALILLSPVLRTAKVGPLEFSFLDSQRSVQPLSSV